MQYNRSNLCNNLDTYTLLIRMRKPIRCMQHNSNISLYCESEQKLLCANCIMGKNVHKYHKVTPIEKCMGQLEQDISKMRMDISAEVDEFFKINAILQGNIQEENLKLGEYCKQLAQQLKNSQEML